MQIDQRFVAHITRSSVSFLPLRTVLLLQTNPMLLGHVLWLLELDPVKDRISEDDSEDVFLRVKLFGENPRHAIDTEVVIMAL
jgi:hypothetical protein